MPTVNLIARTVESLKPPPPKQQIDYWDDSLPGFGVRVSYKGTKTWVRRTTRCCQVFSVSGYSPRQVAPARATRSVPRAARMALAAAKSARLTDGNRQVHA
jgi:hypothetical protein